MIPTLYRGSVKDLLGPAVVQGFKSTPVPAILFRYTDAYSVFDWGRMPDVLGGKGEALALIAADLFEKMAQPSLWKDFSKSKEALALRKGVSQIRTQTKVASAPAATAVSSPSLATAFNEVGERLQSSGLRSHYLGVVSDEAIKEAETSGVLKTSSLQSLKEKFRHIAVQEVSAVRPKEEMVMGRAVMDYKENRASAFPKLIPLEVIFRFSCPPGSSLIKRAQRNPDYIASLAFPQSEIREGAQWDFPLMELTTKLESSDRSISYGEALAISGLKPQELQEVLLKTAWVAGFLRNYFAKCGLEVADGKLEWGISSQGEIFLVDAVGPDELRLLKDGVQISKEFLRMHYRETDWYVQLEKAKAQALQVGVADWKRSVSQKPPVLPAEKLELACQLYRSLANELTGKKWFADAWSLNTVVEKIAAVAPSSSSYSEVPPLRSSLKTVLVLGAGGREHAIAWKLAQSPQVGRIILAPGNDGFVLDDHSKAQESGEVGEVKTRGLPRDIQVQRWPLQLSSSADENQKEFERLAQRASKEKVDLAFIGPDNPLAEGVVDVLEAHQIPTFGPSAAAARIEASKAFAKEIMQSAGIPTAKYFLAHSVESAGEFLDSVDWPPTAGAHGWVVKADGLAFGKGVIVCSTREEAKDAVQKLIHVSGKLVIEERLVGKEISWMAICDGQTAALMEPARDYKRLLNGNTGPNTGGMGSFSPVPEVMTDEFAARVRRDVFEPALKEMARRGCAFKGILYAGLMLDRSEGRDQLWVLEFNARLGDPETQVLLPRMDADLYEWAEAAALGRLHQLPPSVPFKKEFAVFIVAAAPGYPESPKKDLPISGPLSQGDLRVEDIEYFSAGLKRNGQPGKFVTAGGRVLGALGTGETLQEAKDQAYERIKRVEFPGIHYRLDIAQDEESGEWKNG